jgi:hypothetical protein
MSEPILSPDGKMMWSGTDWIPLPAQPTANVQDSVVMGDINTKIEHSVHNTYSQDTEKLVRNHLNLVAEKMGLGQFIQADEMYEKAKHIDYELATELYNGEFRGIFVAALWNELSSHPKMDDKYNPMVSRFIEDRVSQILAFDEEHVPSLLLLTKISLARISIDLFYLGQSFDRAEFNCRRVLSVEPDNEVALNGLRKIEFLKKCHGIKIVVLSLVGLFFVTLIIF